jgi:ArsR family transcriptional regulator
LTARWHVGINANSETPEERGMITFEDAEIRSRIIKAMAHPGRLTMIAFLKEKDRSFSEVFGLFDLDKSTISKHLSVLKEAGIVSSRKFGTDMICRLEVPCVTDFFDCVTAVIENNVKKQKACLCGVKKTGHHLKLNKCGAR